jgi:hypothetical protein
LGFCFGSLPASYLKLANRENEDGKKVEEMRVVKITKQIINNNHRLALWETVIYLYFMDERGRLKTS